MSDKLVIAVIFGGRSVEHDVSILTGIQFLEALDPTRYTGLAVYVDPLGQWWTGDALKARSAYPVSDKTAKLTPVRLDLAASTATGRPALVAEEKGLMGVKIRSQPFDVAVPAIHGSNGEDGSLQGLLDFAAIPYVGSGTLASARTMDKLAAKRAARANGLKVLDEAVICRPPEGQFLGEDALTAALENEIGSHDFPYIVKPRNLGSSVGVSRADDMDSLMAALLKVFKLDTAALVEPCVDPLVEYNIAVRRSPDGGVETSAIEKPLGAGEVLDFSNKYRAGSKGGAKQSGSEGMASLNREIDPESLSSQQDAEIRAAAIRLAHLFELGGSARIDFLSNKDTGEIWFNEVNTIPGSFAYFLWEAAETPISFLALTHTLIEEARTRAKAARAQTDSAAGGAVLLGG